MKKGNSVTVDYRSRHHPGRDSGRNHRRKLRLKGHLIESGGEGNVLPTGIKDVRGYQTLDFDFKMMERSVRSRLVDFERAISMVMKTRTTRSSLLLRDLKKINDRLKPFGYFLPLTSADIGANTNSGVGTGTEYRRGPMMNVQESNRPLGFGVVSGSSEFDLFRSIFM